MIATSTILPSIRSSESVIENANTPFKTGAKQQAPLKFQFAWKKMTTAVIGGPKNWG